MQRVDETRYLWILRAQALFFALSCVLFLVIWLAYDSIDTGVKYQPFLVSGNPKAESVVVSRLSKNISPGSSAEDIAKSLASKYIVERESYGLSREEFLA
ncbi:MAG: hypothetical protein LBH41_00975, partial [Rickettsiales bacterium]|nr:hypothetical protein [Rickettsiales bacterium]